MIFEFCIILHQNTDFASNWLWCWNESKMCAKVTAWMARCLQNHIGHDFDVLDAIASVIGCINGGNNLLVLLTGIFWLYASCYGLQKHQLVLILIIEHLDHLKNIVLSVVLICKHFIMTPVWVTEYNCEEM